MAQQVHLVRIVVEAHTRLDFHKELVTAFAQAIPEAGNAVEQAAMTFHARPSHATCKPDGNCTGVNFATNGRPAIEPIRAYAGLHSADGIKATAALAACS